MSYVVLRRFQDKQSEKVYGVGESFQANDTQRAQQLESMGFIAAENSEAAHAASNQAQNAQPEATNQTAVDTAQTVVDGEVVPVEAAQAAARQAEERATVSGVTEAHNNASEPVQAGKRAKSQTHSAKAAANKSVRTKQLDQKELAANMNQHTTQVDAQQQNNEDPTTRNKAKGKKE